MTRALDSIDVLLAEQAWTRRTSAQVVADTLRTLILEGKLKAGERLNQERLAEQFGLSRMPVREAIRLLEAEGLVAVHSYRFVEVSRPSTKEIEELNDIRILLETNAVRRAVPRLTDADFEVMDDLIRQMSATTGPEGYLPLNRRFHQVLCAGCGNTHLCDLINRMREDIERYLRLYLDVVDDNDRSEQDHRAILDACKRREAGQASILVRRHLRRISMQVVAYLRRNGL